MSCTLRNVIIKIAKKSLYFVEGEQMKKPNIKEIISRSVLVMSLGMAVAGCKLDDDTIDDVPPKLLLNGEAEVTISKNYPYVELGAIADDNIDRNVSVTITGAEAVDTSAVGSVYIITYTARDSDGNTTTVTRTVTITDDTETPTITLNGDEVVNVVQGQSYTDAAALASDNVDGEINLIGQITLDGADQDEIGTNSPIGTVYLITYSYTDVAGNEALAATRTVNIVAETIVLNGTAAAGAAMVGLVEAKGAQDTVASTQIQADGSFSVDVTALTAPYRLRATGTVGGQAYTLHSYASDASTTINVTPFTDLIVANTANILAGDFYSNGPSTGLLPADLAAQETELQAKIQTVLTGLGLDAEVDLLATPFTVDYQGLDAALELVSITINESTLIATITYVLDGSSITDDITASGEAAALAVSDVNALIEAVTDTASIAEIFSSLAAAFTGGAPIAEDLSAYFASNFLSGGENSEAFAASVTADPQWLDISFASLVVSGLDSNAGFAEVSFNFNYASTPEVDAAVDTWLVNRDEVLGWQLSGNQQIIFDDFETDLGGWSSWGPGTVTLDTTTAHTGNGSLKMTGRTAPYVSPRLFTTGQLTQGTTYELSVWVKFAAGGSGPIGIKSRKIDDDPGANGQGQTYGTVAPDIEASDTEWTQLSGTYTHNIIGTEQELYFNVKGPADLSMDYYIDDFVLIDPLSARPDTTPPVITITGSSTVSVIINEPYNDEGATAIDATDAVVTVVTAGSVNTAELGEYLISYTAIDAAGNAATAIRTVNVVEDGGGVAEVISNPGFEDGSTSGWASVGGATIAIEPGESNTGAYSAKITARNFPYSGIKQALQGKLTAGSTYAISAWIKLENAGSATNAVLSLKLLGVSTFPNIETVEVSGDEWTLLSGTYTATSTDIDFLRITVPNDLTANYYVDDVSVMLMP